MVCVCWEIIYFTAVLFISAHDIFVAIFLIEKYFGAFWCTAEDDKYVAMLWRWTKIVRQSRFGPKLNIDGDRRRIDLRLCRRPRSNRDGVNNPWSAQLGNNSIPTCNWDQCLSVGAHRVPASISPRRFSARTPYLLPIPPSSRSTPWQYLLRGLNHRGPIRYDLSWLISIA